VCILQRLETRFQIARSTGGVPLGWVTGTSNGDANFSFCQDSIEVAEDDKAPRTTSFTQQPPPQASLTKPSPTRPSSSSPPKKGGSGGGKASGASSSRSKPGGIKGRSVGKAASKDAAAAKDAPLLTAAELEAQAAAARAQAVEREAKADETGEATFERRLGAALIARTATQKLSDFVRECDRNGDGTISRNEWRVCVRNMLKLKADNKEIDRWFASADADGGGSLDIAELKDALKALRQECILGQAEAEAGRAEAQRLREKVQVIDEAAVATAAWEQANERQEGEETTVALRKTVKKKQLALALAIAKEEEEAANAALVAAKALAEKAEEEAAAREAALQAREAAKAAKAKEKAAFDAKIAARRSASPVNIDDDRLE